MSATECKRCGGEGMRTYKHVAGDGEGETTMKTRAEVVGMPEIVAKRREVQAAYARLGEARKRVHGAPWWNSGRDGTYEAERDAAEAEHVRLTADYEQSVTAAMSQ